MRRLVVGDEDRTKDGHRGVGRPFSHVGAPRRVPPTEDQAAGKLTVNFPPPRGDSPTAMSPDIWRIRCWLTASPSPVPFPPGLGGEERLEDPLAQLGGAPLDRSPGPRCAHGPPRPTHHLDGARTTDGLRGVDQEVDDHLAEGACIGERHQARVHLGLHHHLAELGPRAHEPRRDVRTSSATGTGPTWVRLGRPRSSRLRTMPSMRRTSASISRRYPESSESAGAPGLRDAQPAQHAGERVADLVRHARREPAHRGQPLAGHQLGLGPGEPLVGRAEVLELAAGERALCGERAGGPAQAGLEPAQQRASAGLLRRPVQPLQAPASRAPPRRAAGPR